MGQTKSKDQQLYQLVSNGDVEGIQVLYNQGASLEWKDKQGRTPLIVAAKDPTLFGVAKTLIELGANVNAISRGKNGGTSLHYAAKEGLDHTVALLLSHGANAFVKNQQHQTPLALARKNKCSRVVREIENHICYFAGHIRETFGPGFSDASASNLSTRVIWVVVVPRKSTNPPKHPKLELVIYSTPQDSEPRKIVVFKRPKIKEPKFDQPNPALIIVDKNTKTRYKFSSVTEGDKQQLRRLYNACRGISQAVSVSTLTASDPLASPIRMINTGPTSISSPVTNGPSNWVYPMHPNPMNSPADSRILPPWLFTQQPNTNFVPQDQTWTTPNQSPTINSHVISPTSHVPQTPDRLPPPPSAPPLRTEDELIQGSTSVSNMPEVEKSDNSGLCVICWEARAEGACIPCGHVSGCMSCLKQISDRKGVCPICRSDIHQVVKLYGI